MGKVTEFPRMEVHRHAYIRGGKRGEVSHSHPGGSVPHSHPDTGPSHFMGRGSKRGPKATARPSGPQLDYIEHTPEQNTFRVVFVDVYTPSHASAGITPEMFAAMRAAFVADMAGADDGMEHISADRRMVNEFGLTPIYELSAPGGDE